MLPCALEKQHKSYRRDPTRSVPVQLFQIDAWGWDVLRGAEGADESVGEGEIGGKSCSGVSFRT